MPILLLVGIVLAAIPAVLIIGFAAYIFLGFVNDDKDARVVFNIALVTMAVGIALIIAHVVGTSVGG